MNAEIICVGTELLLGDILNTNARFLSRQLAELGINVFSQSVVGDNAQRLAKQLSLSMARSEVVILSGGLGPTADDITKETVAQTLGLPLEEHAESLRRIQNYFTSTGRVMGESNKKQALTIKGATVLPNANGTAPGYCVYHNNSMIILLPGPPHELTAMFTAQVLPILKRSSGQTIVSHNVRLFGIGESLAAELCGDLLLQSNPTVATYAKTGEVDIRVSAKAENQKAADALCAPVLQQLKDLFTDDIYGLDCDNLQQAVVALLHQKGKKLATAESCTAGMLSSRITEIPGSSDVFEMGVTAYANYIKIQALGVSADVIAKQGAVCERVAAEMASGIRKMCGADFGIGITGVAGPGESEGKPAGLVYIALADEKNQYVRKILCRGSDRENTRIIATSTALDMVRRYLEGCDSLLRFGTPVGGEIHLMEGYRQQAVAGAATASPTQAPAKNPAAPVIQKSVAAISNDELYNLISLTDEDRIEDRPDKLILPEDTAPFVFDDDETARELTSFSADEPDAESAKDKPAKKRGFWAGLFPCKGDSASEKVRKSIFLVALLVLLGTMGYLVNYFAEGWIQNKIRHDAANVWNDDNSMQKNDQGIFIGFESLMEANRDVKAWIKLEGTNIDNPVYQTTDNDYYINHDMNKQSSRYGAIFIDKNAVIGKTENSKNVVVYGHHMRDGSMFGTLKKYQQLDFYKKHSVIDFTTLYREGKYKVFSVFIINTLPEHDNGNVFNYRYPEFDSDEAFLDWVDEIKQRSIIDTGVEVRADDELLTLSTCTYEFDDARLVVVARRVREYESGEVYLTNDAKLNKTPLYPQIWYTKKGLTKPDIFSSEASSATQSDAESEASAQSAASVSSAASSATSTSSAPAASKSTSKQTGTTATKPTGTATSSAKPAAGTTTSAPATTSPGSSGTGGGASTSSQAPSQESSGENNSDDVSVGA